MESQFAIVELMGHRSYGAKVSEVEQFGIKMLRAEVLSESPFVQDVHPQAIYAITLCTEDQAKAMSRYAHSPATERQFLVGYPGEDDDEGQIDDSEGEDGSIDL
jgi:hypothetical protein